MPRSLTRVLFIHDGLQEIEAKDHPAFDTIMDAASPAADAEIKQAVD